MYNFVCGNIITSHEDGICANSNHNLFTENSIADNINGIICLSSSYNNIYRNNFSNNTIQVSIVRSYNNTWDNGYPSGGNYWSDHNPPDEDLDKIGDTAYVIDENNLDRYPLIYPYGFVPKPDVNEDEIVNMLDLHVVASAFGTKPGIDRWDPIADVKIDEIINIRDMYAIAKNYGKT